MIKIITDSSADLPIDIIEQYKITVVPLRVSLNNQEYLEGEDITSEQFLSLMFEADELPKTSQPSPYAFAEAFSKYSSDSESLCLTVSSGLSGTYQSACIGKELSTSKVTVFDTLAGTLGHGLQVIRAAELASEGKTVDEIIANLSDYRDNMNILIILNTLENVVKGGRLSKLQGSLAKILNIKIILERIEGGKVGILEKVRGKKNSMKRLFELIQERGTDLSNVVFGITHSGNVEDAENFKQEIIRLFNPKNVIVNYMGAVIGTYAGKDGMVISF